MSWQPPSQQQSSSKWIPTFASKDIKSIMPTKKRQVRGIILPAFDFRLLDAGVRVEDPAFRASWRPYRDTEASVDKEGNLPLVVPVALIREHAALGPNEDYIVSAQSRANLMPGTVQDQDDPIVDILNYVRGREKDPATGKYIPNPRWAYLLGDGQNKDSVKIKYPSLKPLFNSLSVGSDQPTGTPFSANVCKVSSMAWDDVVRQANIRRPADVTTPRDAEFSSYLYGNMWNPNLPLIFGTSPKTMQTGAGSFMSLTFSRHEATLEGMENGAPIPQEILALRQNLWDPSIYNILTYVELTEYLIAHNVYPIELLREALNTSKPGVAAALGVSEATGGVAPAAAYAAPATYNPTGAPAPAAQAPAPPAYQAPAPPAYQAPAPPAPAPAAPVQKFWVSVAGGAAAEGTRENIQDLVDTNVAGVMVLEQGETEWKTPAQYGITADDIPVSNTPAPPAYQAPAPPAYQAPAPAAAPPAYQAPAPAAAPPATYQAPAAPAVETPPWNTGTAPAPQAAAPAPPAAAPVASGLDPARQSEIDAMSSTALQELQNMLVQTVASGTLTPAQQNELMYVSTRLASLK